MGDFFSSSTKETKQPFETNPWGPQQGYLKKGFNRADDAYGRAQSGTPNDLVADMTGQQTGILNDQTQAGRNFGNEFNAAAMGQAGQAAGNLNSFSANAQGMFDQAAQAGGPQGYLDQAAQYADNPYIQGQIDSALGDVNKAFGRDQASINAGAAGSGNINSTRAGALEAQALDDAMDRGASISSDIRSRAFESGLDRSMQDRSMNFQEQMSANQSLGNAASMGLNFAGQAYGLGQEGMNNAFGAQSAFQGQNQAEINGQLQLGDRDMDLVQRYMQLVGGQHGKTGYTTHVSEQQSPFQTLVGGAATAAGMGAFG